MAFRFNFGKKRFIDIIIKDHVIRFVELKSIDPPVVQRMGERYLPTNIVREGRILDFESLTMILDECISDWKISKRDVRFLVPDPFVMLRKVALPQDLSDDEISGYLYMELGSSIHLPFEDPVFDFQVVPTKDNQTKQILLFAAPEDVVREYMSVFEEVKLNPVAADISSLALYRLYFALDKHSKDETVMLIQIDLHTVNVSIFEDHLPVFMRHLIMDIDLDKWQHSMKDKEMNYTGDRLEILNPLEDIYKEIERVMNFYRYSLYHGKKQVTKVLIDGDHPWLKEIFIELGEKLGIPTEMIVSNLIQHVDSVDIGEIPSQYHLNIGLGLKEV